MRTNLQALGATGSRSQAPGPRGKDTAVRTIPGLSPRSSSSGNSQAEEGGALARRARASMYQKRGCHFPGEKAFPQLREPEPLLSAPRLPPWNLRQSPSLWGDVPCNTALCPGLTLLEASAGLLGMGSLSVGPRLQPVLWLLPSYITCWVP